MIVRQHIGCGRVRGPEASGFSPMRFLSVGRLNPFLCDDRLALTKIICATRALH